MNNVRTHLFINERIINRFLTLKQFNKYNNSNVENLLLNIFCKIVDNDFTPNEALLNNDDFLNAFMSFYDNINHTRKQYYDRQVKNIIKFYNKKKIEEKETNSSLEDSISRIKYKTSHKISKELSYYICKIIINLKIDSSFAQLFVLICKYSFDDEFEQNIDILILKNEYIFNSFSNVQFLYIKSLIDKNIESYNKKINKKDSL